MHATPLASERAGPESTSWAALLMAVMMLIVRNPRAMGRLVVSRRTMVLGWTATAVMFAASALFLAFVVADWV